MRFAGQPKYLTYVLFVQSFYCIVTGLWPLVDMSSFLSVTGPKVDIWLVRTVGFLVTVIGLAMLVSAAQRKVSAEAAVLALGTILGFISIDVIYTVKGTIGTIYLLDAAAEMILLGMWIIGWRAKRAHHIEIHSSPSAMESHETSAAV